MEIVDTDTLSRREFEGLALAEPFLTLLGFIEWAFSMLVWGRAGSGKSFRIGGESPLIALLAGERAEMKNGGGLRDLRRPVGLPGLDSNQQPCG